MYYIVSITLLPKHKIVTQGSQKLTFLTVTDMACGNALKTTWVKATRLVVTLMVARRLCYFLVRYKRGVSWVAVAHRSPVSPT